jgi:hypothetical protein
MPSDKTGESEMPICAGNCLRFSATASEPDHRSTDWNASRGAQYSLVDCIIRLLSEYYGSRGKKAQDNPAAKYGECCIESDGTIHASASESTVQVWVAFIDGVAATEAARVDHGRGQCGVYRLKVPSIEADRHGSLTTDPANIFQASSTQRFYLLE